MTEITAETATNSHPATTVEQPRITKLIIEKDQDIETRNASSNQTFTVKGISVSRGDPNIDWYDYYTLNDLSHTRKISILLREKDATNDVKLPEDMLRRMTDFLASKHKIKGKFDCASFVHAVNGIPYEYATFSADPSKNWEQSDFDGNITAGDTITVFDSKAGKYTHMAIYLGDGLYISKFGPFGPLIVGDIGEMKKGFHGNMIYKLKPKPREQ